MNTGQRLRLVREWARRTRAAFYDETGIDPKRLFNIEEGRQKTHDEDIEKVCGRYPQFSDLVSYGGPVRVGKAEQKALADVCAERGLNTDELVFVTHRIVDAVSVDAEIRWPVSVDKIRKALLCIEGKDVFAVCELNEFAYATSALLVGAGGEIGIMGLDSQPISNPRAKHFLQALHALTEIEVLRVKEGTCARAWKNAEIWSSDILPTDEVTMKVSAHVAAIRQPI